MSGVSRTPPSATRCTFRRTSLLAIVAGDPDLRRGGRGRQGVERYRAAAERYATWSPARTTRGMDPGTRASTRPRDERRHQRRFPIDAKRMYTAGMSGGARVAIMVALNSPEIAGVLARAPGYATPSTIGPLSVLWQRRHRDFNYRELRAVDLRMKSPHRVESSTAVIRGCPPSWPPGRRVDGSPGHEARPPPRDERLSTSSSPNELARADAQPGSLCQNARVEADRRRFRGSPGRREGHRVRRCAGSAGRTSPPPSAPSGPKMRVNPRVMSEADWLVQQLGSPERAVAALVEPEVVRGVSPGRGAPGSGLFGAPHRAARPGRSARVNVRRSRPEISGVDERHPTPGRSAVPLT